jgi:NTP pyrophosphatase (non-canonical NTP hydrolase)
MQYGEIADILVGVKVLENVCHGNSKTAGWWTDLQTDEPLKLTQELVGDKLMLIVTEIAEAKEGHRKNLYDDHLPNRLMIEVELADAVIRICDLVGAMRLDLAGAIIDKLEYNANRDDHKIENRKLDGGKKS